ncbi:PQQ-binding-like beta-propeller repeat protein [Actinoplanes sp. NPDC051861]|uniref:outer membrane protein assembly factor BamB family protein n=1 Tax=Actinoplanes sp. NPDC051861 TaxID=3155170 RepID=UPI0034349F4C
MTIDLDSIPPARARPPRRPRGLPLLLSLLAALLLAASAGPAGSGVLRVVAFQGDRVASWLLAADMLYSTNLPEDDVGVAVEVVARTLDGNEVAWSRTIEGDGGVPSLAEAGTYLVVTSGVGFTALVLDRHTGEVLWKSSGLGTAVAAGDRIALWEEDRLGVLDVATRRVAWWLPFPSGLVAAASDGPHLVVADANGDVFTYVAATGEMAGTATAGPVHSLAAGGGRVYGLGPSSVTALRLPRLDPLWSAPATARSTLTPCGDRLCLADATVRALDPATGQVLTEFAGRGVLAGDVLLRASQDRTWVRDMATGEIRGHLPGAGLPTGCARVDRHLACKVGKGEVMVWRFPSRGSRGSPSA